MDSWGSQRRLGQRVGAKCSVQQVLALVAHCQRLLHVLADIPNVVMRRIWFCLATAFANTSFAMATADAAHDVLEEDVCGGQSKQSGGASTRAAKAKASSLEKASNLPKRKAAWQRQAVWQGQGAARQQRQRQAAGKGKTNGKGKRNAEPPQEVPEEAATLLKNTPCDHPHDKTMLDPTKPFSLTGTQ